MDTFTSSSRINSLGKLLIVLSLNYKKMKRIAFLVLALIANVMADEKANIQDAATKFETDTQTIEICLSEAGTTIEEMDIAKEKWKEIKEDEELDEETKESFTIHGRFIACILEKKDMMKDSKLVLDKILEMVDKEQDATLNKEVITQCLTALNEDNEISREDRAFGFVLCVSSSQMNANEK